MLIDTHTHFYDEWLLPDAEAAVQRALDAGVGKMLQADVDSRERPAMWEIGNRHPGVIYEMLGLYPGSVAENWREELDQVHSIAALGYFDSYTMRPLPDQRQETKVDQLQGIKVDQLQGIKVDQVQQVCHRTAWEPQSVDQVRDYTGSNPTPCGQESTVNGPGPIPCGGPGPAGVPLSALEAIVGGPGPGGKSGPGPAAASQTQSPTPSPIVAIGEIGLDYHEGLEFVEQQKEVLRIQLEMAAQMNLPVNIHLRDAWEDLFTILADCKHLHLRGNLHCFTASYEIYERANRYGEFSVGIGGVVTFKNAGLAKTLERIPLEKILLETDAPYLAPVPHRGQRNESAFLPLVAAKVAEVKGLSLQQIEDITTQNAIKLFGI